MAIITQLFVYIHIDLYFPFERKILPSVAPFQYTQFDSRSYIFMKAYIRVYTQKIHNLYTLCIYLLTVRRYLSHRKLCILYKFKGSEKINLFRPPFSFGNKLITKKKLFRFFVVLVCGPVPFCHVALRSFFGLSQYYK